MKITDLVVEVRNAAFERVGQLVPADLVGLTAVLVKNGVGTWSLTLPVGHRMASYLTTPGSGLVIRTDEGTLISGPTTEIITLQESADPQGTYRISGVDDSIILEERLAYPTPSVADVSAQTTAYDVRTESAEDLMKDFVSANIGPSATTERKIDNLTIETSLHRGDTYTISARFDTLQSILESIGDLSGLGFRVEQNGDNIEFQVYEPADLSANIRMDIDNNQLTKTQYAIAHPKATHVIVGGAGVAEDRLFVERTSTESLAAEALWGRRIEMFSDDRGSDVIDDLVQKGDEILAVNGKTLVSTEIIPNDDLSLRFGIDWNLGDKITAVIGEVETVAVINQVGIRVDADGVRIGATLGKPVDSDFESKIISNQVSSDSRISNLERNSTGFGISVSYPVSWTGTGLTYTGTPATGTYTRFGNMIHFRIMVNCSTVTNFGTGQYHLTLPYAPLADYIFRDGGLHEIGNHYAISGDAEDGTIDLPMYYPAKGTGNQVQDAPFNATAPKTLATTDYFYISGTYEIPN
jgi:hypothetical protein